MRENLRQPIGRLLFKACLAFLFLFIHVGTTCAASSFEEGVDAYKRGDYSEAIKIWQPLAGEGNGDAQQAIGLAYDLGYGVGQSFSVAVRWYRLAAEGGNKIGQFRLGFIYENGFGVTKDNGQAAIWYHKAAEQHVAAAEAHLSTMYTNGIGVDKDADQAAVWFGKASIDANRYGIELVCEAQSAYDAHQRNPEGCHSKASGDFWAGTEKERSPLSEKQLEKAVELIEASHAMSFLAYDRYYAASAIRKPNVVDISPNYYQYAALMNAQGAARIFVRAVYLGVRNRDSRTTLPSDETPSPFLISPDFGIGLDLSNALAVPKSWFIVAEDALPSMFDGGCALVSILFDASGHEILPADCNGFASFEEESRIRHALALGEHVDLPLWSVPFGRLGSF